MPQVLFCARSDREGEPLAGGGGAASGGGAAGNGGAGGASGAGGTGASAGGAAPLAPSGVPALRCTLWTQGPATLEITGTGYLDQVEELELMRGTCTVEAQLELMRGDGGA
jgi:hypothetical protein